MKFDWIYFMEEDYEEIRTRNPENNNELGYLGSVCVGDIAIDLVNRYYGDGKNHLDYDLYVGHEDTGYGYKNGVPYDHADGGGFNITKDITYEEFKVIAEKEFEKYITENKDVYESGLTLLDHANKPLEFWS